MESVMSNKEISQFIDGVVCTKNGVMKCCDILLKKEECVFDEISMVTTYNSENDQGQCKEDEIMIRMEFPGYEEETARLKYIDFFSLVQKGIEKNLNNFSTIEKDEIKNVLNIAKAKFC